MFLMFPGSLKDVVPLIEQIMRGPGRALARYAGVLNFLLLAAGIILARRGVSLFVITVLAISGIGLIATLLFAWRRERLQAGVEAWKKLSKDVVDADAGEQRTDFSETYRGSQPSDSREIIVLNEDGTRFEGGENAYGETADDTRFTREQSEARRRAAAEEATSVRDTWMPGVEAAQRSAIAAAGGLVNVPYLKDDLRVTIASAILTFVSIPVASFFLFVSLLVIL